MGAVHIVNAPMLFSALYAIIKGFLDERTRSKVRIVGANYRPYLLEHFEAKNLPTFLGGTCVCAHIAGGCLESKVGPWQDFKVIDKKLYHKDEDPNKQGEEEKKEEDGPATRLIS